MNSKAKRSWLWPRAEPVIPGEAPHPVRDSAEAGRTVGLEVGRPRQDELVPARLRQKRTGDGTDQQPEPEEGPRGDSCPSHGDVDTGCRAMFPGRLARRRG